MPDDWIYKKRGVTHNRIERNSGWQLDQGSWPDNIIGFLVTDEIYTSCFEGYTEYSAKLQQLLHYLRKQLCASSF